MARRAGGERPPYFVVQRLVATIDHHWTEFNGWALSQGLDLLVLPLDAVLDLTYYWLVKDATEDDVEKLKAQLWLPPKRSSKPLPKSSPWSDESTLASFAALAGAQEVGS